MEKKVFSITRRIVLGKLRYEKYYARKKEKKLSPEKVGLKKYYIKGDQKN